MTGEVTGRKRPEHSLLERGDLDVEIAARRQSLSASVETTETIEDVIKRRILNMDFDDVEKKIPFSEEAKDFKPREELSQEKDRRGLGDLYAEEFEVKELGGQSQADKKLSKAHREIQEIWNKLKYKLRVLTSTVPIPKPLSFAPPDPSAPTEQEISPIVVDSGVNVDPEVMAKIRRNAKEAAVNDAGLSTEEKQARRRRKKAARRKKRRHAEALRKMKNAKLNPGMNEATSYKATPGPKGVRKAAKGRSVCGIWCAVVVVWRQAMEELDSVLQIASAAASSVKGRLSLIRFYFCKSSHLISS